MKSCASFLSLVLTLAGSPASAEGEYAPVPESRREIDLRIEALDAELAEISTQGPKTATLVGLGLAVAGGITMGVSVATMSGSNDDDETPSLLAFIAGAAVLGVGGITATAGGIVWNKRVKRRDKLDAERESLIEERDGLDAALARIELGGESRNGTRFVTLGVRF